MEHNENNYYFDSATPPVQPQPEQSVCQPEPVAAPEVFAAPAGEPVETVEPVKKAKRARKTRRIAWWKAPVAILLAVAIAAGSSAATYFFVSWHWEKEFKLQNQVLENKIQVIRDEASSGVGIGNSVNPIVPSEDGMTPSQVYAQNVGAVVAIANEGVETNIYGQVSQFASSGSGFIISSDGYVVSNYHVVEGAQKLTVIVSDGREHEAELVGYDSANDVSLMKIDAQDLPYVKLGSSDELVVGDQVCAIGNPLGELTSTLTVGYVSAKERVVSTDNGAISMIQTDAAINSGNSGGPLFNTKGEVVGITTAKYSGTSTSGATIEGIGFAIPIDDVTGILDDLKEFGYVTSAYLGVSVRDVDSYGVGYGLPEGAFVEEVVKGAAAYKAGVRYQDIIINLGGHEITSVNDLLLALRKLEIGETTTITVYRSGQQINMNITLEEKPQDLQ